MRKTIYKKIIILLGLSLLYVGVASADTVNNPDAWFSLQPGASPMYLSFESLYTDQFSGSFNVNVPIVVPPGINGMQPAISLNYNSSQPNDLLGVGWSLELGSIERSTKNGIPTYNNTTDTFIFSFGGSVQELVYYSGSEYRPKIEGAFWKFTFNGTYWEVWDKSGTKYTFGSQASSRVNNFKWCIDDIRDTKGNYITINYTQYSDPYQIYPTNIQYTSNANTGFSVRHSVDFSLVDRTDYVVSSRAGFPIEIRKRLSEINVRTDGSQVRRYALAYGQTDAGFSILTSLTQYGSDNTALPASTYTYQTSAPSFSNDPETWVNHNQWQVYSQNPTNQRIDALYIGNLARLIDMNGDGRPDLVYNIYAGYTGTPWVPIYDWKVRLNTGNGFSTTATTWLDHSQAYSGSGLHVHNITLNNLATLADVNGDGLPDLVYNKYTSTTGGTNPCDLFDWYVRFNEGDGFSNAEYKFLDASDAKFQDNTPGSVADWVAITVNQFSSLVDFNGDGKVDLILNKWGGYQQEGAYDVSTYDWKVRLSEGDHFSGTETQILSHTNAYFHQEGNAPGTIPYVALTTNKFATLADLNGDGLPDFVYNEYGGLFTQGYSTFPLYDWKVRYNKGDNNFNNSSPIELLDHSHAYSTATILNTTYLFRIDLNERATLADVNGDGRDDLIYNTYGGYYFQGGVYTMLFDWDVRLNEGDKFSDTSIQLLDHSLSKVTRPWIGGVEPLFINHLATITDIDGDGLPDFIFNEYAGQILYLGAQYDIFDWKARNNSGQVVNLMTQQVASEGSTTTVTYQPSTAYDNTGPDTLPDLPFIIQTVTSKTVNDAMGNQYTTTYNYQDGLYNPSQKEFMGFGTVKETQPDGVYTESEYYQDNYYKKGRLKEQRIKTSSASPNLMFKLDNSYNLTPVITDKSYLVQLDYTDEFTYDDAPSYSRQKRTQYYYDAYGNVNHILHYGDYADSSDDYDEYTDYLNDTNNWIMDKPVHHRIVKNGTTKKESWYQYTQGKLTQQEDWLNSGGSNPITHFDYDSYGNQTRVTNPRNFYTDTVYDSAYHTYPYTVTNYLGHQTQYSYNPKFGVILSQTDVNNADTTSYEYNEFGDLTKVIKPYDSSALPTVEKTYDYFTMPRKVTTHQREDSATGNVLDSYEFFDGLKRSIQAKTESEDSATQIISNAFYNYRGDKTQEYLPYFGTSTSSYSTPDTSKPKTAYEYDALYRVTRINNPDSTYRQIDYNDWVITNTDENFHTRRLYQDAFARIKEVQEDNSGAIYHTYYTYDCLGNLETIRDDQNNLTTYTYDSLSRRISSDDPDMGHWTYSYDPNGNLASQTDAKLQTITLVYDALDRLTLKDYPTGSDITFSYDSQSQPNRVGRLSFTNFGAGSKEFRYDDRGRTTSIIYTLNAIDYTIAQSFDAMDRLKTLTYPDNEALTYNYNPAGQIESIINNQNYNYLNDASYNASSQITSLGLGNGTSTTYTYNPNNLRLTNLSTNGGALQNFSYGYDNVGNITSITDSVPGHSASQSLVYDDLNRLATSSLYGSFGYDSIGNMTNKSGVSMSYGAGSAGPHAVTSTSTIPQILYDANGNMTQKGSSHYVYDYDNRLVSAEVGPAVYQVNRNLSPGWNFISSPYNSSSVATALSSIGGDYDQLSRYNASSVQYEHYIADTHYDQFSQFEFGKGYEVYISAPSSVTLNLSGSFPQAASVALHSGWNLIANPNITSLPVEQALRGLIIGIDYDHIARYNNGVFEYYPGTLTQLIPGESYFIHCPENTTWAIAPLVETTQFSYDEAGTRIEKIAPDGTQTLYIGQYYEKRGSFSTKYIFLGDKRIADKDSDGNTYFYHQDHLGGSNVITNSTGSQAQLLEYKPYGEVNTNSGTNVTDYKFTGKELDSSTELYYFNYRYYDPSLGRFITVDPLETLILHKNKLLRENIEFRYKQLGLLSLFKDSKFDDNPYSYLYDPQNLNQYAYCSNNPINYIDPLGLDKEKTDPLWDEESEKALNEISGVVQFAFIDIWRDTAKWAWRYGYIDVGYTGVAPGSIRPFVNTGFRLDREGFYFYYGFGAGKGAGISATVNIGSPLSSGTNVASTIRGGTGVWGGYGTISASQKRFGGNVGFGWGVGRGFAVTATQTIQILNWSRE